MWRFYERYPGFAPYLKVKVVRKHTLELPLFSVPFLFRSGLDPQSRVNFLLHYTKSLAQYSVLGHLSPSQDLKRILRSFVTACYQRSRATSITTNALTAACLLSKPALAILCETLDHHTSRIVFVRLYVEIEFMFPMLKIARMLALVIMKLVIDLDVRCWLL